MAANNRLEFFFLNLGHFYDHLLILIYATVAALVLPAAFDMSYAQLIIYATPGFVAFGAFALPVLASATAFMLLIFGQIPINDALLSRITTPQYRSRVYAVKFVVSFSVAAAAIPLVALLHETTGFDGMFTAMAVIAAVILLCVLALPRVGVTAAPAPSPAS